MTVFYLWLNAVAYFGLAAWCALRWRSTSAAIGYVQLDGGGRSEYLSIYGGLQLALAIVFALFALRPEQQRTGLLVALVLYASVVPFRWIGIAAFGPVGRPTLVLGAVELAMLVWALALWFGDR